MLGQPFILTTGRAVGDQMPRFEVEALGRAISIMDCSATTSARRMGSQFQAEIHLVIPARRRPAAIRGLPSSPIINYPIDTENAVMLGVEVGRAEGRIVQCVARYARAACFAFRSSSSRRHSSPETVWSSAAIRMATASPLYRPNLRANSIQAPFKQIPQGIALPDSLEGGMIGFLAVEPETTKPTVGKVDVAPSHRCHSDW